MCLGSDSKMEELGEYMVRMFKGRCPDCGKITPTPKDKWYTAIRCQWCGRKYTPFSTAEQTPNIRQVYEKGKVTKSLEEFRKREHGRKVA